MFQLVTDDSRVPIAFRVEHANGAPLQATQLHAQPDPDPDPDPHPDPDP